MSDRTTRAHTQLRHIALFVPNLSGGGVQRSLLTMAAGLRARGYRVDLLVSRRQGAFADAVPEGVRVVPLGCGWPGQGRLAAARAHPSALGALARPVLLPLSTGPAIGSIPALATYLRRERPGVLFAAKVGANLAALLARRRANVPTPIVVSERVNFADSVAHSRRWRWRYVVPAIRRVYPEAEAIVAVSQGTADSFARVTGASWPAMRVVYNPVVGPQLAAQAREAPEHPWLAADRDVPVILGAGRLEGRKGFDLLIRALARVRATRPVRLLVLGEGPDRAALARLARTEGVADAVDLAGWRANPFAFMARADLFVLASDYEGLPGVLIQAMACGCPVVSTDCPDGPREILKDGRHGELVPMRDPDALAAAIARTLENPVPRETLTARAADFSEAASLDAFEALFQEVCARPPAVGGPASGVRSPARTSATKQSSRSASNR